MMSWLVSGTGGFWRKCREDDSPNFQMMRGVSRAGRPWVETLLQAPVDAIEQNVEIDCESLVEEIAGRLRSIGDGGTFDLVLPGLTENIVEVLRRVEERLPGVPSNIFLVGRKRFQLRRTEWPLMLKFINYYLPAPATLADFAGPAPAQLAPVLDDPRDEASGLAAAILYHAVRHDIDDMHVWENQPSIEANDFWTVLVPERGPPIFRGRLPSDMHELFARGVVLLLAGERERGLEALKVAHQVGHPTARRWLEAHGVDAMALPAEASALLFRRPRPGGAGASQGTIRKQWSMRMLFARLRKAIASALLFRQPPKTRDEVQEEYTRQIEAALERGKQRSMQMLFTELRDAIVTSAYVSPYLSLGMASLAARIGEREDMLAWLELAMTYGGEWTKGPATWALSPCAGDPEFIAIVEAQ